MDSAVRAYIDAVDSRHRPTFERLHRLVLAVRPDAEPVMSYGMPTDKAAGRRLFIGAWQHGLSIYGWKDGGDGGFTTRHPGLASGRGTIRIRPEDAATIPDEEFSALAAAVLGG